MLKRIFSLLLCLVLCLSIFPVGAFAAEEEVPAEMAEELHEEFIPAEEPVVEEPPAEEPVVEEPPAEEPLEEEPTEEEPVVEESPAEEPIVEESPTEEPIVEESPAEELEVTFECAEAVDLSALTVYDADGEPVPPKADAATGETIYGTYSLLPGEYSYSFSAEGFEPLVNQTFTVEDSARTFTIDLTDLKTEVEPSAEETSEEETPEEEISVEDPIVTETPEDNTSAAEPSEEELHSQEPALTEGGKTTEPSSAEELGLEEASLLAAPMLAALQNNAPTENLEIKYTDLQELLDENESIKLSALFSALELSVEMAEVTAVEVRDESVFAVVKDAEGNDQTLTVLQAPDPQASVKVTVGTLEYNIVVTNDVDGAKTETVKYIDANGIEQEATCFVLRDFDSVLKDGWYTVDGNLKIMYDLQISGDVHLILKDKCHYNYRNPAKIIFQDNAKLTIYGQDAGTGTFSIYEHKYAGSSATLTVSGGIVNAPNIRLPDIVVNRGKIETANITGNTLVINGGEVTAHGGEMIAGISCQNVTINGGTVTANGGTYAAGIGGSQGGNGGTVTINGGTVTATGGDYGAGIGGGQGGYGGSVTINGGTATVTATGGGNWAAGIGQGGGGFGQGPFIIQNEDLLLIYTADFREHAHRATAEEYRKARERFVLIAPKVKYEVGHHLQTADGTGYEQKETDTLYNIAGFPTEAERKTYDGFTCEGVTQTTVAADGSTVVPIKYKRNLYEIVFDNNSIGPQPYDITARYGATVTVDPGTLSAEGYIFNGWFEDEECTKPFPVPQTLTMPLNGFTLHAGWTARTDTPYTVEHWQQKADGTGYELVEEDTTTMTGTSGEYTAAEAKTYDGFTAEEFTQLPISGYGITVVKIKYTRNSYTITFNANGHGTAPAALTALYGAPVTKPADPSAAGYTFGGWFEDEACTKAFTYTVMPLGGKTLYAKWTVNVYDVTFEGNFTGSTYSQVIQQTYGETYNLPEDDPERAGYNFIGWFTDPVKGTFIFDDDEFLLTEDQTLYAHWRQVPHIYGPVTYVWTGDSCTASRICTKCPEPHTQTETVTGTYVKDTDATCTAAEKGHYKAVFKNAAFTEQTTAAGSVTKGDPLGHAFPDTWQPYSAQQHVHQCTREGCQVYDYAAHIFHGNTCTACGYAKSDRYLIIYGAEGVWTQSIGNALPFTSDAPFDRFVSVNVDGVDIPEDCYTAAEGSTKVNLLPAYLETLSVGQHSLDIVSNDGVASTTFTVKAAPVYYTVSFNMCGHGTQVAAQRVEKGSVAAKPADPSASGYIFYGWYADAAYKTKYNFSTPVNGNLTIYARWVSSTDPGSPKTGDNGQLALWAAMFSASTVALAGTVALAKKKKQEE